MCTILRSCRKSQPKGYNNQGERHPVKLKLVRQQNELDCGLGAAATIGQCSYDKAADLDPNPYGANGLTNAELTTLLFRITGQRWISKRVKPGKMVQAKKPGEDPEVWLIRKPGEKWGHFVVVTSSAIYDPSRPKPFPWTPYRYPGRSWMLIRRIVRDDAT